MEETKRETAAKMGGRSTRLLRRLVRPEGLDPPAYWFEASRSIQLSYGRAPRTVSSSVQRAGRAISQAGQRQQGEIVPVHAVGEIENVGESSSGGGVFGPRAFGALAVHQELHAAAHGAGIAQSGGAQPQDGPGGLGRATRRRHERVTAVAGARLAPAAIGVLDRAEPFRGFGDGVLHRRRGRPRGARSQTAHRQEGTVNVVHAPTAVPTPVLFRSEEHTSEL